MPTKIHDTGITFPDSTIQTTAATGGLPGPRAQLFTSSGTFTVPTSVTAVQVTIAGGGGGGSSGNNSGYYGSAGGSGGFGVAWLTGLTPGASISVTVGNGGTGGIATGGNVAGTNGGTSSFGAYVSATGGTAGSGGAYPSITGVQYFPCGQTSGATLTLNSVNTNTTITYSNGGVYRTGRVTGSLGIFYQAYGYCVGGNYGSNPTKTLPNGGNGGNGGAGFVLVQY